jgi:hypothetical protein
MFVCIVWSAQGCFCFRAALAHQQRPVALCERASVWARAGWLTTPGRPAEMTVNKMLHDGLVRDTQLNQPPSKSMIKRIHAWSAQGGGLY